jgi:patatin-like phospholipase/acyl hydrolase
MIVNSRALWKLEPMALAAKTTSAAPAFFAPVRNGSYEFVDGGLWANNPTFVGVAESRSIFGCLGLAKASCDCASGAKMKEPLSFPSGPCGCGD